jgi:putative MFS transporter
VKRGGRRPWWTRIFFYVRSPEGVTDHQWRLLGVLGVTFLLNQYDMAIIGLALPQIQAGLGVAESDVGGLMAVVRLGAVGALLLALLADRIGRRALLLLTILGFTASTTLTAFARDPREFMMLQLAARAFIAAEEVIAIVVVAEELAAPMRGWGLGILAAFGALGHGLASILFGFVEVLPFGWRALYGVGAAPLLVLAWIRRGLPETGRFEAERAARRSEGLASALQPVRDLLSLYPGRMIALCSAILAFGFVIATALSFASKTLQEVHGYAPPQVTMLYIGGGALAMVGYAVAGVLADRLGRRRVMGLGLALNALGIAVFYSSQGPVVIPAWIAMMLTFMGCDVLFGALGSELFPTSYRSTASGVRMMTLTVGGALGLWTEGILLPLAGSHAGAITWMLAAAAVPPLIILLWIPETAARELEEISPARARRALRAPIPGEARGSTLGSEPTRTRGSGPGGGAYR